jgi:AraC-like DNA-binding protein
MFIPDRETAETLSMCELKWHPLGELTIAFPGAPFTNQRGCVLFQPRGSEIRLRFARGEITARARDCILILPGQRYEMVCPQQTRLVALNLPEQWLKRWVPQLDRSLWVFRGGEGWSAALCAVVGALSPGTLRELTLPGSALADNIGTLLALSAGPGSQGPPLSLFDSLSHELRASLHRPELSPADLAARHRISLRALHYAFATEQTTFMKELIRVRLERGAQLLREGRVKLTVCEVAMRCGFTDTGHFTRRFRERFGQTPAKFRSGARLERASSFHPTIPGRLARERLVHEVDESPHLG